MLMCTDQQLLAIGDAEFVEDIREMMTDGDTGDTESIGNVFIGKAFADQSHNLPLSLG